MNFDTLSNAELLAYKKSVVADISKYKNYQLSKKVCINSCYGACGNEYFRLYDSRLAEGITLSGQLVILWLEKHINEYLNKVLETENVDFVIAIDTDGIYITLDQLINKLFKEQTDKTKIINFIDKFCSVKLQPIIDSACQKLAEYTNAYQQKIVMKRESIADTGIWTAKKRYILNVHDNEGVRYAEPHLKIMGNEAIRSSTPEMCRKMIKETFRLMLQDDRKSVLEYIAKCKEDFRKMQPEDIAFPRSVNGLNYYSDSTTIYKKSTPIHVRGSLLYNKLLTDLNLSKKYPQIKEGEKIRFVYLKKPNTIRENIISFIDKMPMEFGVHKYIDYDLQFEKTFFDPIKAIFDCIGWQIKETNTLKRFFK